VQCLFSSKLRILCPPHPIATMYVVEGEFGEQICTLWALLSVSGLKYPTNDLVEAPAS
jgi:hypothetical protein